MEIKKNIQIENQKQTIQLLDGEFTPSQAFDLITALINQKINYHKLEGLKNWERDHKYDEAPLRNRIKELEDAIKRTKDFMLELKHSGKNLKIDGVIKMSVIE
ncbi:MAG: hypothetical protein ABI549_02235 [Flavobacterium sp.]|uniref:hypothetical protein n=1 Tax=Flavobacterium sp. TaxID=239 RepID=UPI0032663581